MDAQISTFASDHSYVRVEMPEELLRFFSFLSTLINLIYDSVTNPMVITEDDIRTILMGRNMLLNNFRTMRFFFNVNSTLITDECRVRDVERTSRGETPLYMTPLSGLEMADLTSEIWSYAQFYQSFCEKKLLCMVEMLQLKLYRCSSTKIVAEAEKLLNSRWGTSNFAHINLRFSFNPTVYARIDKLNECGRKNKECNTYVYALKNILEEHIMFQVYLDRQTSLHGLLSIIFRAKSFVYNL
ncbi:hypothetical protein p26 [Pyrus virus A]|uniref:Uncharacterized protein n=1 Tax=Pyrus virus A TaxID=3139198 RepID=A0AAU6RUS1_9CLOS